MSTHPPDHAERAREVLVDARIVSGDLFGKCAESVAVAAMLFYAEERVRAALHDAAHLQQNGKS